MYSFIFNKCVNVNELYVHRNLLQIPLQYFIDKSFILQDLLIDVRFAWSHGVFPLTRAPNLKGHKFTKNYSLTIVAKLHN